MPGSTEWIEIGYSNVNTTESKMNFSLENVVLNTVNELHLRARSGNDTGNIGVGEYYEENNTFSFYIEGKHFYYVLIVHLIKCTPIPLVIIHVLGLFFDY